MAELIVTHAHGRSRGSGYRINATEVLTAAHVIEDALSVTVRFSPDLSFEQVLSALSWRADPSTDIAYLEIPPQSGEAVQFGRVGTNAAVLQAHAVGFPLWKMRDGQYRDSHHAVGTVAVLSNFREGTLEFVVPSPPAPGEGRSPWEGMSGAALWVDGRIVGVVSKHHPSDGLGRLAVAPLTGDYPDVVTQPGKYDALLADIAPDELLDRSQELAELVSFCAGHEPYMWWQAGPWAGKTALMSWFALHPPKGVDVVSFFITAGQSDSDTFLESVIEQLGETAAPNRANLLRLLQKNACSERRLLLVVDGLDEDTSKQAAGRPSIASLLPRRVPSGLRVLVASRPNPDLPDDVPGDHPLRTVNPRPLVASSRARHIEIAARNELSQLLQGEPLYRDILGLLTASGSGLTVNDLEELTGQPRYELERVFSSAFARSLTNRQQVYLFAHKTLRETAEARYGASLAGYREQLHGWAQSYVERQWPENTPGYLVAAYPEMLAANGQAQLLAGLAADRARHDWLLGTTWGDAQALAEIDIATGMSGGDLATLLRLALARSDLQQRNRALPSQLPGVWVRLGETARAMALADSITEPDLRAKALQGMIAAAPRAHHEWLDALLASADAAVAAIDTVLVREQILGGLAGALASAGKHERALLMARAVTDPTLRAGAMIAIAGSLPADIGRRVLREIRDDITDNTHDRLTKLAALVKPTTVLGDYDGFARLAAEIEDAVQPEPERVRGEASALLAAGAATLGELDLAAQYFQAAETVAQSIDRPEERASALIRLLKTAIAIGDGYERLIGQLDRTVREIADDYVRMRTLRWLAQAARDAGDFERCAGYVAQIAAMAEPLYAPWPLGQIWAELAGLLCEHPARAREFAVKAERTARQMPVDLPNGALAELAAAAAIVGDQVRASQLAGTQAVEMAGAKVSTGEQAALSVRAAAGDRQRVARLVSDAEARVRNDALHFRRQVLGPMVEALVAISEFDEALRVARSLADRTVVVVVGALLASGQSHRAIETALDIHTPAERAEALGLAAARKYSLAALAESSARAIGDYESRCRALARLANALSTTRHFDDTTRRLLSEVLTSPAWYVALAAVARLDPQAVRELCDEVSGGRG